MSLRSNAANGGGEKRSSSIFSERSTFVLLSISTKHALMLYVGEEKQKKLLESDAGHFSMIKYSTTANRPGQRF